MNWRKLLCLLIGHRYRPGAEWEAFPYRRVCERCGEIERVKPVDLKIARALVERYLGRDNL